MGKGKSVIVVFLAFNLVMWGLIAKKNENFINLGGGREGLNLIKVFVWAGDFREIVVIHDQLFKLENTIKIPAV